MSEGVACPRCSGGPLGRHGTRTVEVALVEGPRLRWGTARIARMICRSCGRTSGIGEAEVEALMSEARRMVATVYARHGMEAAVEASGLTDRTVERWAESMADESLADPLPTAIVIAASGRAAVVADAMDGSLLDAAPLDASDLGDALSRRGGEVEVAWVWPDAHLREAAERAFPGCEIRIPASMARSRLDGLLAPLDAPRGNPEARLLSFRVSASGWDAEALERLRDCVRTVDARGHAFLALWDEALVAGLGAPDPAPPPALPPEASVLRLRALIAFGLVPRRSREGSVP